MHLWRAVTIITVSVQKEVGDMDQSALQEFFYGEGYRSFSAGPEEITVYYRYVSGDVHAVIMIDMQNGYRISRGNHEILEEYVKNIFFDSGNASTYFSEGQLSGHVDILTILVGTKEEREVFRGLCFQCQRMWAYILPEGQLMVYENQQGDFQELRQRLESLVRTGDGTALCNMGKIFRKNFPWVTIILVLINAVVYLILEISGDTQDGRFIVEHGGMYPEFVIGQREWWRIFTAGFIHFGAAHLVNNMVIFCCVGSRLECATGHLRLLLIYLLAELGGGVCSCFMMLYTGDYAVSAGASGAVFGTIAGLLWVVILHRGTFGDMTARGLIFMLVISLYYGFSTMHVDNWGHIGGAVSGFAATAVFYHRKSQND